MKLLILALLCWPGLAQLPDFSTWTWLQRESATLTTGASALPVFSYLGNTGNQHEKMLLTSLPAPPYTVTFGFIVTQANAKKQSSGTLILRNSSTGKALAFADEYEFGTTSISVCGGGRGPRIVAAIHAPSVVGVAMESVQIGLICKVRPFAVRRYLRIVDDGTTRSLLSSSDDMRSWETMLQEASGAYSTFDQAGIAGYTLEPSSFQGFMVTVLYWSIT